MPVAAARSIIGPFPGRFGGRFWGRFEGRFEVVMGSFWDRF